MPELLEEELELLEEELELLEELELDELELLDELLDDEPDGGGVPFVAPPHAAKVAVTSATVSGRTSPHFVKTKLLNTISSSVQTCLYFMPKSSTQRLLKPLGCCPSLPKKTQLPKPVPSADIVREGGELNAGFLAQFQPLKVTLTITLRSDRARKLRMLA